MKKELFIYGMILILAIPVLPTGYESSFAAHIEDSASSDINFHTIAELFGGQARVVVSFRDSSIKHLIERLQAYGVEFAFGSPQKSRVGPYYLLHGPADGLQQLKDEGVFSYVASQTPPTHLHPTRDVSIPEINADEVWSTLDSLSMNLTGKGILVADLDTGVDWKHPSLWFAGDTPYSWIDTTSTGSPTNGTDGIDLDGSGTISPDETLYYIDLDGSGTFNATTDWIWVDNVTQNGVPDIGEPFFVVDDANGNGQLDPGESLYMLTAPKTRYIVEKSGGNQQVWVRGVNLTASTHQDTSGHGTAVAGILLGGQIGYRKYVGVAPEAELMMIKVLGSQSESLTVEEALTYAYTHGADVILTEFGSWTYQYLDGSSGEETLIDTIVADGIPVISPSGNLGGKEKHALSRSSADIAYQVDFTIPPPDGFYVNDDIENVYITFLSVNHTDFFSCNFSIIFNLQSWGGGAPPSATVYLHPGSGHYQFVAEPPLGFGSSSLVVESFISTSTRGTQMLGIWIWGNLPTTTSPPWHQLNMTTPTDMTFHSFISDDQTSWTGGATWMSDISNEYLITWPSTADSALSVASYHTRDLIVPGSVGAIASFSPAGPRIDDTPKQGIAAPGGYDIISDYSNASYYSAWYNDYGNLPFGEQFGSYQLFSGTSASGPHVAGCAALLIQMDGTSGSSVASIITSSARNDSFTGDTPNEVWGYGKLDVLAAVKLLDVTAPTIYAVSHQPDLAYYYDTITVEANVTDETSIHSVLLRYEEDGWTNPDFVHMTLNEDGNYSANIGPFAYGVNLTYAVFANDTSGNEVQTAPTVFGIGDDVEPWIGNFYRNATTPGAERNVLVSLTANEPLLASGVDTVLLNYTVDSWASFNILHMSKSGDTYTEVIPGQPLGTHVVYYFIANDTAGNVNASLFFEYTTISDETNPPVIDDPLYEPAPPEAYEDVTIRVSVSDDTAVDQVILSFYNGTAWNNVTMILVGDEYQANIPGLAAGTEVTFRIYASDTLGNWAVSDDISYTVSDTTTTTPPETTETTTDTTTPTTGTETVEANPLIIAAFLSAFLLLVVLSLFYSRRRS